GGRGDHCRLRGGHRPGPGERPHGVPGDLLLHGGPGAQPDLAQRPDHGVRREDLWQQPSFPPAGTSTWRWTARRWRWSRATPPRPPRPAPRWRPLAKVSRWPPFRGSTSMCWNSPESTPPTRPWPTGSTFTAWRILAW